MWRTNLNRLRRHVTKPLYAALAIALSFSPLLLQSVDAASSVVFQRNERQYRLAEPKKRPARTYDVQHYVVRTRFDVPKRTVIGNVTVSLKPLNDDFTTFQLDAGEMQIESVSLEDSDSSVEWSKLPGKLSIQLDRPYTASEKISVRIKYRAQPKHGLYFVPASRFGPAGVRRSAQIWTQGEPEDHHHWFPCYDFPDDKATSEQYITTGADETAISNGRLVEIINNADKTRTFHYRMEQPHSTYLISLVVGKYSKMTSNYKNIPLEFYTYPGTERQARSILNSTPAAIAWFAKKLDYEFPFEVYSQSIVANFIFGGMENITATTYLDIEVLLSNDATRTIPGIVIHELAHSWFGNLVTCKDWANLWLNEGFATFLEAAFKEDTLGRAVYLAEMQRNAEAYFSEDRNKYRRPIATDRYREPIDLFDDTLYKKGAFVVHMLRELVGDEAFWKALNTYLNEYRFQSVGIDELQRVFENETGTDLGWFFDQWLYKAGHPELRVRYSYEPGSKRLVIDVQQTQVADERTPGVFRLPVEVEIATRRGKVLKQIEITERVQKFTIPIENPPLSIRFDKREQILKKVDIARAQRAVARRALQPHSSRPSLRAQYRRVRQAAVSKGSNPNGALARL